MLGALALGLLVVIVVVGLGMRAAPLLGRELFTITGGSMEPTIPIGSMVVVEPVDPDVVAVGDVITIRADNGVVVTHRVAAVTDGPSGRTFQLKGDANATADGAAVPAHEIVGRVAVSVPWLGSVRSALAEPAGLTVAIGVIFLLVAADALLGRLAARPWTSPEVVAEARGSR